MPPRRTLLRHVLLLCGFVLVPAACTGSRANPPGEHHAVPPARPDRASIDDYLRKLEVFGFSGAVLVARGDDVILAEGYGEADPASGVPITPETVFYSASISKQFTAAAVMMLAERGRLALDDSLPRFFEDVPADKRGITVHQLLTHSAGLVGYHPEDGAGGEDRESWVRSLLAVPLESSPGTRAQYSNPSFSLLAAIVEVVSGQAFEAFMHESVFRRAGLEHTGFSSENRWPRGQIAQGVGSGIKGDPGQVGRGWGWTGASGVMTSVADLWRWERALREERVLSRESLQQMFQGYVPLAPPLPIHYGYGWRVQDVAPVGQVIWASGIDQPFSAMYRRYAGPDVTLIFLSNGAHDSLVYRDALFVGLTEGPLGRLALGDTATPPPGFLASAPIPLARYAGSYDLPDGGRVVVVAHADYLEVLPVDQRSADLLLPIPGFDGDSLTGLVRAALSSPYADADSQLGLGPLTDEGIPHPAPADSLGRFVAADWLVTLPVFTSGTTVRATTYGMLRFERGTFPMRWRWWNGGPYGRDIGLPRGVLPPFRPASADRFVSYHIPLRATLEVRFAFDAAGQAAALLIPSGTGVVRAGRSR